MRRRFLARAGGQGNDPARTRADGGDPSRRSRILGAAGQLFAGTPYDEVSIDDIAGRAGVAKGLLYYYFGSKRGLFIELMREIVDGLTASRSQARTAIPSYASEGRSMPTWRSRQRRPRHTGR